MLQDKTSNQPNTYVQYVSNLLRYLATNNSTTYQVLMDTCTKVSDQYLRPTSNLVSMFQELISAACGLSCDSDSSVEFLVTKSCAMFLADCEEQSNTGKIFIISTTFSDWLI